MQRCGYIRRMGSLLVLLSMVGSGFAASPADDDPGMGDGWQRMQESDERWEWRQKYGDGKDQGSIWNTMSSAPDKVYSTDETGQVADGVTGAVLEKLGGKVLGNVPVSDAAQAAGQVAGGDYDGAAKTVVKTVFSTIIGYGATLLVPATAPVWAPILVGAGAAYGTKKVMDYIMNVPPPPPGAPKGISIGKTGELQPPGGAQPVPPSPATLDPPDPGGGVPISLDDIQIDAQTLQDIFGQGGKGAPDAAAIEKSFGQSGGGADAGLKGSEASSDGGPMTVAQAGGKGGGVDGFVQAQGDAHQDRAQAGFKSMQGQAQVGVASTAGDKDADQAKGMINQGGQEGENIKSGSASKTASADQDNTLGKTLGEGLISGVEEGGKKFGEAVGGAAAVQVNRGISGKGKKKSSTGGAGKVDDGDEEATTDDDDLAEAGDAVGAKAQVSGGGPSKGGKNDGGAGAKDKKDKKDKKGKDDGKPKTGKEDGASPSGSETAPGTPKAQTQKSGSFTAKLVPSGSSYWIEVSGISSNSLSASVSGTDGYTVAFSGTGSIKSSTIPAGTSGVRDTVMAKDNATGETASFVFTF